MGLAAREVLKYFERNGQASSLGLPLKPSRPLLFGRDRSGADPDEGLGRRGERPVAFGYEHEGSHKGEPPNLERAHRRLRLYRARRDDADARARSDGARD